MRGSLTGVAPLCPLPDHDPEGRGGDPAAAICPTWHRVITRVRHGHTIRGLNARGVTATLVYAGPGDSTPCYDWMSRGQKARVALGQLRHEPCLHRGDHAPSERAHRPLPSRQEPGRGRGPGTVAGATKGLRSAQPALPEQGLPGSSTACGTSVIARGCSRTNLSTSGTTAIGEGAGSALRVASPRSRHPTGTHRPHHGLHRQTPDQCRR